MRDLIEKAGDVLTGGNFSKNRLKRQEQARIIVNQAVRKIDFHVQTELGKDILEARVKQLTPERNKQLQDIAAKADKDGLYQPGILTYNDFYQVALAAAELQPGTLPSYLNNAEMFTWEAVTNERISPSSPIILENNSPVIRMLVKRLKVSVDNASFGHRTRKLEFTITPDQPRLEVHGKIAETVWEKIHATGLPLRDTTWLHSIYE